MRACLHDYLLYIYIYILFTLHLVRHTSFLPTRICRPDVYYRHTANVQPWPLKWTLFNFFRRFDPGRWSHSTQIIQEIRQEMMDLAVRWCVLIAVTLNSLTIGPLAVRAGPVSVNFAGQHTLSFILNSESRSCFSNQSNSILLCNVTNWGKEWM